MFSHFLVIFTFRRVGNSSMGGVVKLETPLPSAHLWIQAFPSCLHNFFGFANGYNLTALIYSNTNLAFKLPNASERAEHIST